MKRPGTIFTVVVLLWMSVEIWCVSDKTTSMDEKRALEPFPRVSRVLERGYDFGARFERWFADHFRRRKSMVRLSGQMRLRGNSRVLHGKNGWIYLAVMGSPEMFAHDNRFGDEEIATLQRRAAAFGRQAKAAGVKHVYFTVSNDKESLCPEFYPEGHPKMHPESRLDQFWNALQAVTQDVTMVRFTDRLLAAKKDTEVFCRCGSHMNDLASFLVYGWLSDRIVQDFPSYAKVGPEACRFGRDFRHTDVDLLRLGAVPYYPKRYRVSDYAELKSPNAVRTKDERRLDGVRRKVLECRNEKAGNELRLYLLTDSFGWRWVPYLAESVAGLQVTLFGEDHPYALGAAEARELYAFKPDIVIVNFTERFLQRLLTLEFPKEVR